MYEKYTNYVPYENMITHDNKPQWIVVHTADSKWANHNSIQNYHITFRKWENTGYHYIIEKDGALVACRPEHYHGAHVGEDGINKKSIGICLSGDHDVEMPTENQVNTLRRLLTTLSEKYNIPKEKIVPHRHFTNKKTCFGSLLSDDWARNLLDKPQLNKEEIYKMLDALKEAIRSI